jgi:hypothetical protein
VNEEKNGFQACEQFTVLSSRTTPNVSRCDVCDQIERIHPTPGRRVVSGGELEALRRRMLIAVHERREDERRHREGNGANPSSAPAPRDSE